MQSCLTRDVSEMSAPLPSIWLVVHQKAKVEKCWWGTVQAEDVNIVLHYRNLRSKLKSEISIHYFCFFFNCVERYSRYSVRAVIHQHFMISNSRSVSWIPLGEKISQIGGADTSETSLVSIVSYKKKTSWIRTYVKNAKNLIEFLTTPESIFIVNSVFSHTWRAKWKFEQISTHIHT